MELLEFHLPFRKGFDNPILFSADPEVKKAKVYLSQFTNAVPDEHQIVACARARHLVTQDYLSRCTFTVGNQQYQVIAPRMNVRGSIYLAHEVITDQRITNHLVKSGSASIKPISSPTT